MTQHRNKFIIAASAAMLSFAAPGLAEPQQSREESRSGGGGKASAAKINGARSGPTQAKRASAHSSVNPSRNKGRGNTVNVNKGSGNVSINKNNNVNVNVSNNNRIDRRYGAPPPGYRSGGYYYGGNYYYDDNDGLGFLGKVAVASTAALVVGAILKDKPDNCEQSIHSGQVYMYCNGTWYQPVQSGSNTNYVVVNKP